MENCLLIDSSAVQSLSSAEMLCCWFYHSSRLWRIKEEMGLPDRIFIKNFSTIRLTLSGELREVGDFLSLNQTQKHEVA